MQSRPALAAPGRATALPAALPLPCAPPGSAPASGGAAAAADRRRRVGGREPVV